MSGQFEARWLALREEADARARDADLAARLSAFFEGWAPGRALRVLDLGAGAGNNLRATSQLLPQPQHWRLVDSDAGLLDVALARLPEGLTAEPVLADLADGVAPLLADPTTQPDLVTASALFDLCSRAWIERFVAAVSAHRLPLYVVLSYDGRQSWAPPHPLDEVVIEAFHRDQGRDKGLGPSLGPAAHAALVTSLRATGYTVFEAESDWVLEGARDAGLIGALAAGTAAAVAPYIGPQAAEWGAARALADPVTIGHGDLLAIPAG
ncbi:MAG: class I SAM-dependent methyltransferase [Pseudomonadota bacterium]